MLFNDTVTNLGICQEIDSLCDSDTTSYPLSTKTRRVNTAYETLIADIINADGTWQFDDRNYTTLPEGTANLQASTASYSFSDKFLNIEEVKVLDVNGIYHRIQPVDPSEGDISLEEKWGSTTGFPQEYDKVEDTIILYPAPTAATVTLTAGLKVRFKRTASLFTATDTSKEPGIASPYHIILAWMAALPYCKTYKQDRVAQLERDITIERHKMVAFYGQREKDRRKIMTMKQANYI